MVTQARAIASPRGSARRGVPRVKYQSAAHTSTTADAAFERIVKKLKKFAMTVGTIVAGLDRPPDRE